MFLCARELITRIPVMIMCVSVVVFLKKLRSRAENEVAG